jgi:5-methylcytosine-specific restriction endonuclease McrA
MVWVPKAVRLAIYKRDGWVCGVCSGEVEPGLPASSPWQATLDHVVPRSLGGSDDPENLRLVHRYCNSVRSNRLGLTLDDLAA